MCLGQVGGEQAGCNFVPSLVCGYWTPNIVMAEEALTFSVLLSVSTADGGREAIRLLEENVGFFKLLITDVVMPGVDGIQLLRYVRSNPSLMTIPVIMISAHDEYDKVFECVVRGADDFLLKPLAAKELRYIWQHVCRRLISAGNSTAYGFPPQIPGSGLCVAPLQQEVFSKPKPCLSDDSSLPQLNAGSESPGLTLSGAMPAKSSSLDDSDLVGKVFPGLPPLDISRVENAPQAREMHALAETGQASLDERSVQSASLQRPLTSADVMSKQDPRHSLHSATSDCGTERDHSISDFSGAASHSIMTGSGAQCESVGRPHPGHALCTPVSLSSVASGRDVTQRLPTGSFSKAWSCMDDTVYVGLGQGSGSGGVDSVAGQLSLEAKGDTDAHETDEAKSLEEPQPKSRQEYELGSRQAAQQSSLNGMPPGKAPLIRHRDELVNDSAGQMGRKGNHGTNMSGSAEARFRGQIQPKYPHEYALSSRLAAQESSLNGLPPVASRQPDRRSNKRLRHQEPLSQQILKQQQLFEQKSASHANLRTQLCEQPGAIGRRSDGFEIATSSNLFGQLPAHQTKFPGHQGLGGHQKQDTVRTSESSPHQTSSQDNEVWPSFRSTVSCSDGECNFFQGNRTDDKFEAGCTTSSQDVQGGRERSKVPAVSHPPMSEEVTDMIANASGLCTEVARAHPHLAAQSLAELKSEKECGQIAEQKAENSNGGTAGEGVKVAGTNPLLSSERVTEGEMTLRQWLSRSQVVHRVEALYIFKQILEFVDLAHRQGVILRNVRPSCFLLSSLNKVGFIESGSTGASSDRSSEWSVGISSGRSQVEHLGRQSMLSDRPIEGFQHAGASYNLSGSSASDCSLSRGAKSNLPNFLSEAAEGRKNSDESPSEMVGWNGKDCFPQRQLLLMEQTWYASPEELSGGDGTFGSDIYRLGVLFFELFCTFSSSADQARMMSDLKHRILPPSLLSACPKEAAFCLWLLHPEPNSRPKTGEILSCELLTEVREALAEREAAFGLQEKEAETDLLLEFLIRVQHQKQEIAQKSSRDVQHLLSDIEEVGRRRNVLKKIGMAANFVGKGDQLTKFPLKDSRGPSLKRTVDNPSVRGWLELEEKKMGVLGKRKVEDGPDTKNELKLKGITREDGHRKRATDLSVKSARMMSNFNQLEKVYFSMRSRAVAPGSEAAGVISGHQGESPASSAGPHLPNAGNELHKAGKGRDGPSCANANAEDWLGCFFDNLCKYARYSRFEVKATLRHGDLLNTANMVGSLSFDRDEEFFATAGVCKRIKVFECDAVLNEHVDIHYPVVEMTCRSKLTSICWNSYIKSHIASSDYDGVVQLWDASTGKSLREYAEHQRRAWSVDFSRSDPTKLASGSDDGCVKLWSINQDTSIGTIRTKANVCCVQFPTESAHLLAFGSADYRIFCYDLRNTKMPLCILANHTKAVSYVKFLDSGSLVSASTDNTLKLWDLAKASLTGGVTTNCAVTFSGHTNEKNFVGLSVADGYIACGAETNAVFAYHKSLPMPMASHKFGCADPVTGQETEDDSGLFVSSVCWRGKSQTLLAANSIGNIKVLELV